MTRYPLDHRIIWQFDTANFRVIFHAEEEDLDPEDNLCDAESVAFAREGGAHWFRACVSVWYGRDERSLEHIASDYLGACSYNSFEEFCTSHRDRDPENRNTLAMKARNTSICHYFPDMVREAISRARIIWAQRAVVKLRAA